MKFENLLYEVKDQIAYVAVNRPDVRNALNVATLGELNSVFAAIKLDSSVRVVILTGAGDKAFVAGADIKELKAADGPAGRQYAEFGQSVFNAIENLGKPAIAVINGHALGGGCELAMACTLRLAAETALIGQPEVMLGVMPGFGGTQRLPRLVGKGVAMKMLLTGEPVSAAEALRVGLVNEVHPSHALLARAETIAKQIIANAPLAVQHTLEAANHGLELPLQQALFLEQSLFGVTCATEDKNEGTTAFFEKRPAQFKGR